MNDFHKFIELTDLSPLFTGNDLDRMIEQSQKFQFAGICIPPFWVKKACRDMGDENISVGTVIGHPFGYNMAETKAEEIGRALEDGASEIDVVFNLSAFHSGMTWPKVELARFAKMTHEQNAIMKVVLEPYLMDEEGIKSAAKIACDAGADFLVSSTQGSTEPVNIKHIQFLRKLLPEEVGIKAVGGIETYSQAKMLIGAGAERIGTANGFEIMSES